MRKRILIWTVTANLGLLPVLRPVPAQAGAGVFATEYTQLLNYATLIGQYSKQIQLAANAFSQVQIMINSAKNLKNFPVTSVQNDLTQLFNIAQGAFGVAYSMSQLDQQFGKLYTGYSSGTMPYSTAYGNWQTGTLAAIQNAVASAGMQPGMITSEQGVMSIVRQLMRTPQGQEQSVQLGYTISLEMNNQLQRLRAMMASDLQSKAAFEAFQVQKDAGTQQMTQDVLKHMDYAADHTEY